MALPQQIFKPKPKNDDHTLAMQMQAGDRAAFTRFVDAYGPVVHRLSRKYARTEADAEDLTQEILVAACQSIRSFKGQASLSTWVYRVALNHCMKHSSRQASRPQTVTYDDLPLPADGSAGCDPAQSAMQTELRGQVDAALSTLSPSHRDVVVLHELQGLTYTEIAQILDVPVGTVKSRLFHAFGKLRERLNGYVKGDETDTNANTLRSAAAPLAMTPNPTTAPALGGTNR